jgi:hypothetical protein
MGNEINSIWHKILFTILTSTSNKIIRKMYLYPNVSAPFIFSFFIETVAVGSVLSS